MQGSKYIFTEQERYDTIILKEECDREGIAYDSIFELAKYNMVTSSLSTKKKRLENALKRIKANRKISTKYHFDNHTINDIYSFIPMLNDTGYDIKFGYNPKKKRHIIYIGYKNIKVFTKFISSKENFDKFIKMIFFLYDLCCIDLEEARNGMECCFDFEQATLFNSLSYLKLIYSTKFTMDETHPYRFKTIHILNINNALTKIVNTTIKIFPKKIRDRFHFCKSIEGLNDDSIIEWIKERYLKIQENNNIIRF